MMSVLKTHQTSRLNVTSTGCSPIDFSNDTKSLSSPRKSRTRQSYAVISDSEDNHNLQEERRQEFEKFKRKKLKNKHQGNHAPKFAIGQPVQDVSISALFPQVKVGENEGRHVPTADGDKVFIPKLNLEDQWSSLDSRIRSKRPKKNKKDLKAFLDNLHLANQLAFQLKQ